MRKLVRYVLPVSNESSSKLHNFSCFTPRKWLWKQAKFTSAACAEVVRDQTRSTTPCGLVRSKRLCAKRYFADSTLKQWVNDLYKSRWTSWRLTNHGARIVMLGLQNGFWLTNLLGRKSLSCIDFFLYKFKQHAVHISVENYFMHRIPNYLLDMCTKKTSKREKTIVIKLEINQKKMKSFTTF